MICDKKNTWTYVAWWYLFDTQEVDGPKYKAHDKMRDRYPQSEPQNKAENRIDGTKLREHEGTKQTAHETI